MTIKTLKKMHQIKAMSKRRPHGVSASKMMV
jgi:hypothetical protein